MNRRKVLSWFGLGWLFSGVPTLLTACSNDQATTPSPSTTATTTSAPKSSFRAVGSVAQLEKDGQLKADGVLVIRDRNNPTTPLAFNSTCTHKGCTVDWKDGEFVCPCHGAVFAPDGSVRKKPAKEPLATYAVKVENGQVLIASK
ncbi:Rieske (2Fe-2S) protein [Tumidithrix elongata RA019]|uniref:Rieske (2Fe-2S) protein n=1 Tax=Tumidithrix elongata BACA0141 TaxID=2716417 RepID=A0AAW9Q4G7_9CYAN|nr:Rieske (2Fe-2S) protein [Tumidithrix elongata RA019]